MTFSIKNGDFKGMLRLVLKYRNECGLTRKELQEKAVYQKPTTLRRIKLLNKLKKISMSNRSSSSLKSIQRTEYYTDINKTSNEPQKTPTDLI